MNKSMEWFMKDRAKRQPEEDIIISYRFTDDKGKPLAFKIKAVGQKRVEELMDDCTKTFTKKGRLIDERLDNIRFVARLVVDSTIYPNFKEKELLASYGVVDPVDLVKEMLLPGEYAELVGAVQRINGYDEDFAELVEEAKN